MSDVYALDSDGWWECEELPGWAIKTHVFKHQSYTGVAIERGDVRHAVRSPLGVVDEAHAIKLCLPTLKEWASA